MLATRIFILSWLICKSFIHFEFILVYVVGCWSSFIFLHLPVQFSKHYLLKNLFLLHCMLVPLYQILTIGAWVYYEDLYSVPHIYVCVRMPVPDCFDYSVLSIVWYQVLWSLLLHSSFSRYWGYLGLLLIHINSGGICSIPLKYVIGIFPGVALNLSIALGSMDILMILILPIHKHGIYFHLFVPSSISFFTVL